MFNILKTAALSAMIGLGPLAAAPSAAQADGLYLNFGGHHSIGVFSSGHHRDHRWSRHTCSPRQAVRKAARMGVRHAHVSRTSHRSITVKGSKYRHHVRVRFARSPGCPVIG